MCSLQHSNKVDQDRRYEDQIKHGDQVGQSAAVHGLSSVVELSLASAVYTVVQIHLRTSLAAGVDTAGTNLALLRLGIAQLTVRLLHVGLELRLRRLVAREFVDRLLDCGAVAKRKDRKRDG